MRANIYLVGDGLLLWYAMVRLLLLSVAALVVSTSAQTGNSPNRGDHHCMAQARAENQYRFRSCANVVWEKNARVTRRKGESSVSRDWTVLPGPIIRMGSDRTPPD
jgi:hypothetical protein